MARRAQTARDWEFWARADPYYAVLAEPDKVGGGWQGKHDEFFASGAREVQALLGEARQLGFPRGWAAALDFGCGLGRVTQALSPHFGHVVGVDISAAMVRQAKELHKDLGNVEFAHIRRVSDLSGRPPFDLIWCVLVLQHLEGRREVAHELAGLFGLLAPGGLLVVEIPS
ncbi:MAG TPA: class I SAM-dependent methyltransferase, partial [Acidimicrobiales bacterium]|nr:class I SAM-dependent methyltransferase [Acidimicrobiales bacterium]